MEAILVALITGGLSLLGVVITNMMAARRADVFLLFRMSGGTPNLSK